MSERAPHPIVAAIASDFVLDARGPHLPTEKLERWAAALLETTHEREELSVELLAFAAQVSREAGNVASEAIGQLVSLAGILMLDLRGGAITDVDVRALSAAARTLGVARSARPVERASGPSSWLATRVPPKRAKGAALDR